MVKNIKESTEQKYGLINEIMPTSTGEKNLEGIKPELKKKYLADMKEDTRPVTARFYNHWPKGADHKMIYKNYACEPVQTWNFKHNETYVVPYGLVKHINNNCKRTFNTINPETQKAEIVVEQLQEFIPVSFN